MHKHLAMEVGVPEERICVIENGQIVEISEQGMVLDGRVTAGDVFVDGSGVGDVNPDIMREREELSRDGMILISVGLDRFTGDILGDPEIITRGFITARDNTEFLTGIRRKVLDAVKRVGQKDRAEIEQITKAFIYSETRRRPYVVVNISKS